MGVNPVSRRRGRQVEDTKPASPTATIERVDPQRREQKGKNLDDGGLEAG